ncbi:MAG: hypothetical protein JSR77_18730, partial [Planctomycetes bacterium]|nr:hypothetical protein [Planctomycetota bacterium]
MSRRHAGDSHVEPLEGRVLLSTVTWDGGAAGTGTNWFDPTNWAGDVLPGPGDDAVISTAGPTIVFGGTASVNSVSTARAISFNSGALTLGTVLNATAATTMTLNGGRINGGTVDGVAGAAFQVGSGDGTLDGVT